MTAANKDNKEANIRTLHSEENSFHDWTIKFHRSHILHSLCTENCSEDTCEPCLLCLYTKTLDLPHLPEMVFAKNLLSLKHQSGGEIQFNALDALKCVCVGSLPLKVACSEEWNETRSPQYSSQKIKPFDWTYSSDYRGTVSGPLSIIPTEERIDIEKLKQKERILYYQELTLYEDELHDNGISSCTVKIRVMPSSFFILLRFFLRVDNVTVKINDTRIYHEFTTNFVLREFSSRECGFKELNLPLSDFGDPNVLAQHIPLRKTIHEKILIGGSEQNSAEQNNAKSE